MKHVAVVYNIVRIVWLCVDIRELCDWHSRLTGRVSYYNRVCIHLLLVHLYISAASVRAIVFPKFYTWSWKQSHKLWTIVAYSITVLHACVFLLLVYICSGFPAQRDSIHVENSVGVKHILTCNRIIAKFAPTGRRQTQQAKHQTASLISQCTHIWARWRKQVKRNAYAKHLASNPHTASRKQIHTVINLRTYTQTKCQRAYILQTNIETLIIADVWRRCIRARKNAHIKTLYDFEARP